MVDDEDAGWFAPDEQRPITFERRLALLEARRREEGLAPPDLAIAASLFWDEKVRAGASPPLSDVVLR